MTFCRWPPGLLLLAQVAHLWVFPPLLVLLAHQYVPLELPASIWIIAYLLATPAMSLIKSMLQYFREEREIKQLGARRLPLLPSKWPGALDCFVEAVKSFNDGYPGMELFFSIATHHPMSTISWCLGWLERANGPNLQCSDARDRPCT